MTIVAFLKDKIIIYLMNMAGIFLLSLYLLVLGNRTATVVILSAIWFFILLIWTVLVYRGRYKFFQRIDELMDELDQPYLVQECMEESWRLEDRLYREILRRSNKAVIERINQIEEEQREYREFIEGWIHEVKLPITGVRLAVYEIGRENRRRIEGFLTELDNGVDQALFYARSDKVYQDYRVRECDLEPVIGKVIKRNKYLLIQNGMSVDIECCASSVYTDAKWLEFILTQVLINAVKYKKEGSGNISFHSSVLSKGVKLSIKDEGIGIPEEELSKIFEKGFTGTNGRKLEKSTGIGLYLCRKLCKKLGIEIIAESKEGSYTKISILFPKSNYFRN